MSSFRLGWVGLLALLALLARPPRASAAPTLSTRDYLARVEQVSRGLATASQAGKEARAQAERALQELPEEAALPADANLPAMTVDNRELLHSLRHLVSTGPKGIRQAGATIEALREAVVPAASPPPTNARRALTAVLKKSEFETGWWAAQQQRFSNWLDRALRRLLRDRWSRLHLGLNTKVWGKVGIALLVMGALALVYLIVRLLTRRLPRPTEAEDLVPSARPKVLLPHAAWLQEAERCLQSGDYLTGVRALHMAALMQLDEAGLVRYDHAYTDSRFVRLLQTRGHQDLARLLGRLNQLFARLWYGRRPAGPQEYQDAADLWREVEGQTHE